MTMREVQCPDGSVALFPDAMSDDEIAAVLQREFVDEPRPASLSPGEWTHRRNGASVTLSASMLRYVAYNAIGQPCGFRPTLDAAIDLADALPPPPAPRVKQEPPPMPAPQDAFAAERELAANIDASIRRSRSEVRLRQHFEIIEKRRKGRR